MGKIQEAVQNFERSSRQYYILYRRVCGCNRYLFSVFQRTHDGGVGKHRSFFITLSEETDSYRYISNKIKREIEFQFYPV